MHWSAAASTKPPQKGHLLIVATMLIPSYVWPVALPACPLLYGYSCSQAAFARNPERKFSGYVIYISVCVLTHAP
jgi:hypothetical protein